MIQQVGRGRAQTNIALIKYWGKRDKTLFLPMNSSLSLTLDAFYTITQVTFDSRLTTDVFYLNDVLQDKAETAKITKFLNLFKRDLPAEVVSYNFVPTAAGLASSASAFAALAVAVNEALGLNLDRQTLSSYARRGSGSSTRSLFGGFVEWDKGTNAENSVAVPIDKADWDIAMLVLVVDTQKKKIASRVGMDLTVETSPFYAAWVKTAEQDLIEMKQAIETRDFDKLGQITEHNAMKMHATTLSANPPFTYWTKDTLAVQDLVRRVREETGLSAYMTIDAGPNVKLLCRKSQMAALIDALSQDFPREKIIPSGVGRGASVLTALDWQAELAKFHQKS